METLHLTLNKKWFDMILSGLKKEEYREIKEYWKTRLVDYVSNHSHLYNQPHLKYDIDFKDFDKIIFKNGYNKNSPMMIVECEGIEVKKGKEEWGAEKDEFYFAIKLGNILGTNNLDN